MKSRSSILIIFILLGAVSVGVYSSALMTITVFSATSAPLGIVLFPKLNLKFLEEPQALIKLMRKLLAFYNFTTNYNFLMLEKDNSIKCKN